jgi:hypothetical protein
MSPETKHTLAIQLQKQIEAHGIGAVEFICGRVRETKAFGDPTNVLEIIQQALTMYLHKKDMN